MNEAELISLPEGTIIEAWRNNTGRMFIKQRNDFIIREIIMLDKEREWVLTNHHTWGIKDIMYDGWDEIIVHGVEIDDDGY